MNSAPTRGNDATFFHPISWKNQIEVNLAEINQPKLMYLGGQGQMHGDEFFHQKNIIISTVLCDCNILNIK